jgi:hypothetical protein
MIHIALQVAYALFVAWLGLNALLVIALGAVVLFTDNRAGSPRKRKKLRTGPTRVLRQTDAPLLIDS